MAHALSPTRKDRTDARYSPLSFLMMSLYFTRKQLVMHRIPRNLLNNSGNTPFKSERFRQS